MRLPLDRGHPLALPLLQLLRHLIELHGYQLELATRNLMGDSRVKIAPSHARCGVGDTANVLADQRICACPPGTDGYRYQGERGKRPQP
jgi:hypothetical protein